MSLLDRAMDGTDDRRFRFERVGDKLVGRIEDRRTVLSDHGEVELLTIKATACVMGGIDHGAGGVWDLFMGSKYLRAFIEEHNPPVYDYVSLVFMEERKNQYHEHASKVICGAHKHRGAVEPWYREYREAVG